MYLFNYIITFYFFTFLPFYFFTFLLFYLFTFLPLIKESQEPEWYLIALANLRVITGVDNIRR